jgi:hypothetical protein
MAYDFHMLVANGREQAITLTTSFLTLRSTLDTRLQYGIGELDEQLIMFRDDNVVY